MKKLLKVSAASAALVLVLAACGGRGPGMGFIYTSNMGNHQIVENDLGSKTGEACASTILGLISTGDASAGKAASSAGITKMSATDDKFLSILGLYQKYCTVVRGN